MLLFLAVMFLIRKSLSFPPFWRQTLLGALVSVSLMLGISVSVNLAAPGEAKAQQAYPSTAPVFGNLDRTGGTQEQFSGRFANSEEIRGEPANQSLKRRIREGTRIPDTSGSVSKLGRRWIFKSDQASGQVGPTAATLQTDANLPPSAIDPLANKNGLLTRTTSLTYTEATADRRAESIRQLPEMLIVENLMLQRIVEAIREDPGDDRWTVTGKIIEYFDENRLVILSAERTAITVE